MILALWLIRLISLRLQLAQLRQHRSPVRLLLKALGNTIHIVLCCFTGVILLKLDQQFLCFLFALQRLFIELLKLSVFHNVLDKRP